MSVATAGTIVTASLMGSPPIQFAAQAFAKQAVPATGIANQVSVMEVDVSPAQVTACVGMVESVTLKAFAKKAIAQRQPRRVAPVPSVSTIIVHPAQTCGTVALVGSASKAAANASRVIAHAAQSVARLSAR